MHIGIKAMTSSTRKGSNIKKKLLKNLTEFWKYCIIVYYFCVIVDEMIFCILGERD